MPRQIRVGLSDPEFLCGLSAPRLVYPLEAHARLERNSTNLIRLAEQIVHQDLAHVVLAMWDKQIEVLTASHFLPVAPWLEGCVPVLLEPYEFCGWHFASNTQIELLLHQWGVFEVRFLEDSSYQTGAQCSHE